MNNQTEMTDYERGVRDMARAAHEICGWMIGGVKTRAHAQVDRMVELILNREQQITS